LLALRTSAKEIGAKISNYHFPFFYEKQNDCLVSGALFVWLVAIFYRVCL
jgi:hypothetical protein